MDGFLKKFFPGIAEQASTVVKGNLYCQYNRLGTTMNYLLCCHVERSSCRRLSQQCICSPTLQLMTSVLFLAGAICEVTGTTGEFSCAMILSGIDLHGVLFRELTSECINAAYLSRYHGRKKVCLYSRLSLMSFL